MKKSILFHFFIFFCGYLSFSQVPQAINYQGIVRDSIGKPIANSTVNVKFSVREGSVGGNVVFQETHSTSTNNYGLINLPLGQGTTSVGFFNQINWHQYSHFLQVEANDGVSPYVDLGTTQFLSVPYAQTASTALNVINVVDPTPPGAIIAFGGNTIPTGWLKCDGSEVSRTTYSNLFSTLGIFWGPGNGTTTFHLPDFRGRFPRGVDEGVGNDPDANSRISIHSLGNTGDNVGSYQTDTLKSHSHSINVGANTTSLFTYVSSQAVTLIGTRSSNTFGGNETRPKNAYVYYIIKY